MEENKENTSPAAEEGNDEDEGRPPVDPNNKLYTFLSLLIFAVCYTAYQLIKQNFTLAYAVYENDPTEECAKTVYNEVIGTEELPEGCELQYIRMHRNFDSGLLYVAVSLPYGDEEEIYELAEKYIPYQFGDGAEDERFAVYPYPDMTADYVYGNSYVSIDNPADSCIIYEDYEGFTAVFRSTDYDRRVREALSDSTRIKVK